MAEIDGVHNANRGEIIIYRAEDNTIQLDVRMENETVWLTAGQMAQLFGRDVKTIRKHINNALHEELADEVVGAKFASTTQHGAIEGKTQTNEVMFYNLEMITSIGFRVKSKRGIQFRKWANIFSQGELNPVATVSKMETVVNRGFRGMELSV